MKQLFLILLSVALIFLWQCLGNPNTDKQMNYKKGTFGYDLEFLRRYHNDLVILRDSITGAELVIAPAYQARVMTSSVYGKESNSNGWINYQLIASGKKTPHMNAFGGEERLWLGPEGGPFSLYFKQGSKQVFENWQVPAILDTLPFNLEKESNTSAEFSASVNLVNYSGNKINARIERKVSLLNPSETELLIQRKIPANVKCAAYLSSNTIVNTGKNEWNKTLGMPSIWMLCMLSPSPDVVVFIPFKQGEKNLGSVVNDDYFGKIPADRLKIEDGIMYFKADGNSRGKIGVSAKRAKNWACSYDPTRNSLTMLYCNVPENGEYVNSKWGDQPDPMNGDAFNAYNDGPVDDGAQMGPFYELESSSPAANLKPGERLVHNQTIIHMEGSEANLDSVVFSLFNVSINRIKTIFK